MINSDILKKLQEKHSFNKKDNIIDIIFKKDKNIDFSSDIFFMKLNKFCNSKDFVNIDFSKYNLIVLNKNQYFDFTDYLLNNNIVLSDKQINDLLNIHYVNFIHNISKQKKIIDEYLTINNNLLFNNIYLKNYVLSNENIFNLIKNSKTIENKSKDFDNICLLISNIYKYLCINKVSNKFLDKESINIYTEDTLNLLTDKISSQKLSNIYLKKYFSKIFNFDYVNEEDTKLSYIIYKPISIYVENIVDDIKNKKLLPKYNQLSDFYIQYLDNSKNIQLTYLSKIFNELVKEHHNYIIELMQELSRCMNQNINKFAFSSLLEQSSFQVIKVFFDNKDKLSWFKSLNPEEKIKTNSFLEKVILNNIYNTNNNTINDNLSQKNIKKVIKL